MKKLTYKDFKIGQTVTCVSLDHENNRDMWEQHLTIGKQYVIEDLDFHFPDGIVVPSDNGRISMFFPIPLFSDIKLVRKTKLDKINKNIR